MSNFIDLTGQRFGRLVVLKRVESINKGTRWLCKCDCGKETVVYGGNLKFKHVRSCGCLRKKITSSIHKRNLFKGIYVNLLQSKLSKKNTSGVKGVSFTTHTKLWRASIQIKRDIIYLGSFKNINDAITARKEAEEKYFKPVIEEYEALKGGE